MEFLADLRSDLWLIYEFKRAQAVINEVVELFEMILTESGYIGHMIRRQSRASFRRVRQERVFALSLLLTHL